ATGWKSVGPGVLGDARRRIPDVITGGSGDVTVITRSGKGQYGRIRRYARVRKVHNSGRRGDVRTTYPGIGVVVTYSDIANRVGQSNSVVISVAGQERHNDFRRAKISRS